MMQQGKYKKSLESIYKEKNIFMHVRFKNFGEKNKG